MASAFEGCFAPAPHQSSFAKEASPHKKSNGPLPVDWDERFGFPHAQGIGDLTRRDRSLDGGHPMLQTRWEGNHLLVEWEKATPHLDVLRIVAIDCQLGRPESLPTSRIHDEKIHQQAGIFEIEVKALRVIVSIGRIEKGTFRSVVHAIAK
ncbi:MAG: hypothetical protein RMJ84_04690 [Sandaracinaceae bacterium]|nr:hypothetical protein [Sandaracinaceae bacterium]